MGEAHRCEGVVDVGAVGVDGGSRAEAVAVNIAENLPRGYDTVKHPRPLPAPRRPPTAPEPKTPAHHPRPRRKRTLTVCPSPTAPHQQPPAPQEASHLRAPTLSVAPETNSRDRANAKQPDAHSPGGSGRWLTCPSSAQRDSSRRLDEGRPFKSATTVTF